MAHGSGSKGGATDLYHRAFKKISHMNPQTNEMIVPQKENGWKFELFLHNFMPRVERGKLGILTVDRETEFAPVKNADANDGRVLPDTPAMARKMIFAEATKWLEACEFEGL